MPSEPSGFRSSRRSTARPGESWLTFSRIIEQAGADALELNLYEVVTDLSVPGAAVERQLAGTVRELKRFLKIPIAVKVSPFFAAFGNVARQLDERRCRRPRALQPLLPAGHRHRRP